jgi:predicted Zn-dependent protease
MRPQQHPQVVEEFGGPVAPALGAYVADVGRRVADYTGVRNGAEVYRVTALNSSVLNAFAVPGGYVYVTRELLAIMNDEAELAFVLGHEMGHVAARHSQQRQSRSVLSQLGAMIAATVTGSEAIGSLASQIGQGMVLSYSRSQENEADNLGIRYIAAAGYDPQASYRLLADMGAAESLQARFEGRDQRAIPNWASSHPLTQDRVARTSAMAARYATSTSVQRNRDRFLAAIDGMLFGDDPRQGVVEGRKFIHPTLRFRFTAPPGYGMQNGSRSVTISGTDGQAEFGMGRFEGDFDRYIGQVLQGLTGSSTRVDYATPRLTRIHGLPAAYTTLRAQTQQGQLDVTVFAYEWDRETAYHFVTLTRAGTGFGPFGPMLGSLTRISEAEVAAIRPRVIDVVTVRPGDTVQSLASRMAYRDFQLERFTMLNALLPNSALVPGQKVKLIVYG